ncbi:sodium/hydrogen exchanger 9B2-like [Lineus longissimus]|uniref:sodium/hydrogen exchanger 9B2-like n=1 Tax=Lineus longissimus TaxID=88925 RepID=UPI002B4D9B03
MAGIEDDESASDIEMTDINKGTLNNERTNFDVQIKDDQPNMQSSRKCCRCCDCKNCMQRCYHCCMPCMTKENPLPDNATRCDRIKYGFLCPPHGKLAKLMTLVLAVLLMYGTLWAITGKQALPGGNFFGLLVMLVLCLIGGALVEKIRLPPLLGMLVVGFLLQNVPVVNVGKDITPGWSSALRNIALVVILTRAGLGLNPIVLRKLSLVVLRLAFTPCLVEAVVVAIASHLLLGFPWPYGFMLGFVLAAVSPAVIVPSMLSLEEKGYGTDKGVPTLVIAAASVDDVLAISAFGIVLGIAFSNSDLAVTIVRGPLEALLGVVYGILFGLLAWYFPHSRHKNVVLFRCIIILAGGLFAVFGSIAAEVPGAGALGSLTIAFVAAIGWRKRDKWEDVNPVTEIMASLWVIFQPLLFGLIGNEIVISQLDGSTVGLGVAVLCIGLVFRVVASFLVVFRTNLTWRERFFIPIAWLPKATVQAAIGPIALDTARQLGGTPEEITLGLKILTIAVLVIMITAPVGSALIALTGPKLLKKSVKGREGSQNGEATLGEVEEEAPGEVGERLIDGEARPKRFSFDKDEGD